LKGGAKTMWAGVNVAIFCLRLAQAQGHLAHYALKYEAIVKDKWHWSGIDQPLLCNLLLFYGEWFSTLKLHAWAEADLIEIEKNLTAYGLSVDVIQYSQHDDPRYALSHSLVSNAASAKERSLVLKVSIPK
jgi:hypothetical protein